MKLTLSVELVPAFFTVKTCNAHLREETINGGRARDKKAFCSPHTKLPVFSVIVEFFKASSAMTWLDLKTIGKLLVKCTMAKFIHRASLERTFFAHFWYHI
jgi:hypothetical protein